MEREVSILSVIALACALAGCPGPDPVGPSPSAVPEPKTTDQQVAIGDEIFRAICSHCHGDDGRGGDEAPALVGEDTLGDFETAQALFDYVKKNMPPGNPGALEDTKYWAAIAWILRQNRVDLGRKVLGPSNAAALRTPPRSEGSK